jgi:hypothetical protein
LPSRRLVQAIFVPSGDHSGSRLKAPSLVSRSTSVPSERIVWMSVMFTAPVWPWKAILPF